MESDTESCLPSKVIRFVLRKCHRAHKAKPSKKLTDLNDDCLEHIFSYLGLQALVAVAEANERFKTAAELAFVRNFGRGKLVIWRDGYNYPKVCIPNAYSVFNQSDLAWSSEPYPLLRYFGHLISKHDISVEGKRYEYKLLKYVKKYCRESTTEIFIRAERFYNVNKPFPNAQTVSLDCCHLNNARFRKTIRLNELFPNVRNLSIDSCDFKRKCIALHFPQLNQLKLVESRRRSEVYHTPIYVEMLHLNPQLRSLALARGYSATLLWVASQQLQFLEHLELHRKDFEGFGESVVNFPCLKELKLTCHWFSGSPKIPILANNLKVFEFGIGSAETSNVNALLDFLHNHPTITKFNFAHDIDATVDRITNKRLPRKIIEALPLLEEIDLSFLKISVAHAIRLMKDYKSLKKLFFLMDCNVDLNLLEERAGVKCHLVCVKVREMLSITRKYNLYCLTSGENVHSTD